MKVCAHIKCSRDATEAWDVFSWFKEKREQTPRHYEVCDKHAAYFAGSFDCRASERVQRELVEYGASKPELPPWPSFFQRLKGAA